MLILASIIVIVLISIIFSICIIAIWLLYEGLMFLYNYFKEKKDDWKNIHGPRG
jgi:hypothetical protein